MLNRGKEMLQSIVESPAVHRLGWALIHFLWQGVAIAIIYVGFDRLLRHLSSHSRYLLGLLSLVTMAACPIATFCVLSVDSSRGIDDVSIRNAFMTPSSSARIDDVRTSHSIANGAVNDTQIERHNVRPTVDGTYVMRRCVPLLVVGWFAIVALLSLRLTACCWATWRLPKRDATRVSMELEHRIKTLCRRLPIRRAVSTFESSLVSVPTTIGWLRPIILLPTAVISNLSAIELDAIFVHELAHIRRHDYLINFAQRIVETLLFYHPAVWWISGKIRTET